MSKARPVPPPFRMPSGVAATAQIGARAAAILLANAHAGGERGCRRMPCSTAWRSDDAVVAVRFPRTSSRPVPTMPPGALRRTCPQAWRAHASRTVVPRGSHAFTGHAALPCDIGRRLAARGHSARIARQAPVCFRRITIVATGDHLMSIHDCGDWPACGSVVARLHQLDDLPWLAAATPPGPGSPFIGVVDAHPLPVSIGECIHDLVHRRHGRRATASHARAVTATGHRPL